MVTSLSSSGLSKNVSQPNRRLPFSSGTGPMPKSTQASQPSLQQQQPTQTFTPSASAAGLMSSPSLSKGIASAIATPAPAPTSAPATTATTKSAPAATVTNDPAPALKTSPQDSTQRFRTGTERALQQLETRYQAMFDGIQLKYFDANKIENYIRMAEKRTGMELTEKERFRLIQISKSTDPNILKLLAMELRIGIPKRLEQAALAALGELMLYRDDEMALQAFLDNPRNDENLKAYVRTVLMMNKVERVMAKVENAKETMKNLFGKSMITGLFDQSSGEKKKRQQQPKENKKK